MKKILLSIGTVVVLAVTGTILAAYFNPSGTRQVYLSWCQPNGDYEGSSYIYFHTETPDLTQWILHTDERDGGDGYLSWCQVQSPDGWTPQPFGDKVFTTETEDSIQMPVVAASTDGDGSAIVQVFLDNGTTPNELDDEDEWAAEVLIHRWTDE